MLSNSIELTTHKNLITADRINASIILQVDEDITYLEIDDPESSFTGTKWYVGSRTFLKRGLCRYPLIRDVFAINYNWQNDRAFIERGVTLGPLKYQKDNLPLPRVQIEETVEINNPSIIQIFYNQPKNSAGSAEIDLTLVSSLPFDAAVDYEDSSAREGIEYKTYFDDGGLVGVIRPKYANGPVNASQYIGLKNPANNLISRTALYIWGMDLNGDQRSSSEVILSNGINDWVLSENSGILNCMIAFGESPAVSSVGANTYLLNGTKTIFETLIGDATVHSSKIKELVKARTGLNDGIPKPGIVKKGNSYFIRTVERQSTLRIDISKTDYIALTNNRIYETLNKGNVTFRQMLEDTLSESGIYLNIPKYKITTTLIATTEAPRQLMLKTTYPKLNNAPVKCIAIDDTLQNRRWAAIISQDPNVVCWAIGLFPPDKYRKFALQQPGDTIPSINIDMDDVTIELPLNYPPGNKEYDSLVLLSPAFITAKEIDLYDNGGLSGVTISYRIKPTGTTYYVIPYWKEKNGQQFDNKDGLIITEDLSGTLVTSEFANLVFNNRNIFNSFNSQQNLLKLNQEWDKKLAQHELNMSRYTGQQLQSQYNRMKVGNLPIIGDIASLNTRGEVADEYREAARADYMKGEQLREATLINNQAQFDFSIMNSKAIPEYISQLDSQDIKTRYGLVIQTWSTLPEMKAIVDLYKKENGEPINALGTFSEFNDGITKCLFKGRILRSTLEPNIERELNSRLEGGMYLNGI